MGKSQNPHILLFDKDLLSNTGFLLYKKRQAIPPLTGHPPLFSRFTSLPLHPAKGGIERDRGRDY
jgi:hypothetical protein